MTQAVKNNLTVPVVILGVIMIACTMIISGTIIKVKGFNQTITITGAAYKPIMSDFAIWEGDIMTSGNNLELVTPKLKESEKKLKAFLKENGFSEDEYSLSGMQVNRDYNREGIVSGFTLRQHVKLEMDDVARITKLSQNVTNLIEQGVEFQSYEPRYMFTRLNDLKIEMIKAATENARVRAEQIAESTGRKVGAPRSAKVGVFQIRPLHSQSVSDYGMSDVSSLEKEIACTVHIDFAFE